ncbi:MAG: penicillin-insensitive murein endopeptidase [Gammaproteobacteria bacterium]
MSVGLPARGLDTRWARMTHPTAPPARVIGGVQAGCLAGAEELPLAGTGFQRMHPGRRRGFGHPALVRVLETLSRRVHKATDGVLLIGDLSQPRGGPMPSGHRSHQTGIDADIWYWMPAFARERALSTREQETLTAPSFVPVRSDLPWQVLKFAAETDAVDRIFVHAAIKRQLCQLSMRIRSPEDFLWLQKIRPWWGHHDHFHLRLKCPADSPNCIPQVPVPAGEGCDATLDWWFTEEARREAEKTLAREPMRLPPECERVAQ